MSDESTFDPAWRLQLVKYFCAASLTLQGYDWLICLDREIDMIWLRPWRGVKVLYLLSRYIPFVHLGAALYYSVNLLCSPWLTYGYLILQGLLPLESSCQKAAMLVLRTYAIFNCSKKILVFLLAMLAVLVGVAFPTLVAFLRSVQFSQPPTGMINGCYPVSASKIIFVAFIAILLFETIIVALTVYSALRYYTRDSGPMIKVLYRDSLCFFFCIFSITLVNVLVAALLPNDSADLLNRLQASIHSIVSTRIIFHLRQELHADLDMGPMSRANAVTMSLHFAPADGRESYELSR
ncbi:hypothetical protein MSAN_00644100 [Mycena sanguinolenta]|uniref:DUF6533 domain-containing protein n=1 Tax=Mycena sanguinolenta TaxID=230812 RepID=A0A8H6Z371_9AGAR|nr:hypothetical protein MSAN_00644100 [Mycena sanguinolenta]